MPTKNELKRLIHCTDKTMSFDDASCGTGNYSSPAVNALYPNIPNNYFRSKTSYLPMSSLAWDLYFDAGRTLVNAGTVSFPNYIPKNRPYPVRCVSP